MNKNTLKYYEKDDRLLKRWKQNNANEIAIFKRNEKSKPAEDINKYIVEAGIAVTTADHVASAQFKKTKCVEDKDLSIQPEAVMNPVAGDEKDALLQSTKEYLKKRNLLKPEEKYRLIACSNWVYGWKLGESKLKLRGPEYGKINHIMNYLQSRVGPLRDPDHYRQPESVDKTFVML